MAMRNALCLALALAVVVRGFPQPQGVQTMSAGWGNAVHQAAAQPQPNWATAVANSPQMQGIAPAPQAAMAAPPQQDFMQPGAAPQGMAQPAAAPATFAAPQAAAPAGAQPYSALPQRPAYTPEELGKKVNDPMKDQLTAKRLAAMDSAKEKYYQKDLAKEEKLDAGYKAQEAGIKLVQSEQGAVNQVGLNNDQATYQGDARLVSRDQKQLKRDEAKEAKVQEKTEMDQVNRGLAPLSGVQPKQSFNDPLPPAQPIPPY